MGIREVFRRGVIVAVAAVGCASQNEYNHHLAEPSFEMSELGRFVDQDTGTIYSYQYNLAYQSAQRIRELVLAADLRDRRARPHSLRATDYEGQGVTGSFESVRVQWDVGSLAQDFTYTEAPVEVRRLVEGVENRRVGKR